MDKCDFGALRRNLRHGAIKHKISDLLQQKELVVIEEAQCQDDLGTNRRADILAFHKRTKNAYLIDPTVRFETNEEMDRLVREEKAATYDRCFQDLARRYPD